MAPLLIRRVPDSSISSAVEVPQHNLFERYYPYGSSSISSAFIVVPLAIIIALVLTIGCCARARRLNAAKANIAPSRPRDLGPPSWSRRPQAAAVPPPVSGDVLDPPPPYVPLQTLAPVHKPVDDTLDRPADNERNVGNHGQARSMSDV